MRSLAALLLALPLCAAIRYDDTSRTWILTSGSSEIGVNANGQMEGAASCVGDMRLALKSAAPEGTDAVRFTYLDPATGATVGVLYGAAGDTGVFTREASITVAKPGRFVPEASLCLALPAGPYDLTYLHGSWGQERQVAIESIGPGRRAFVSDRGRSTRLYSPWFALHNKKTGVRYAAQLAWSGNWEMGFEQEAAGGGASHTVNPLKVWLGARTGLGYEFTAGAPRKVDLPRVAFTTSKGSLDDLANNLHQYQRGYVIPAVPANRPMLVQFNSWYPFPGTLKVEDLKRTADVAAEIGSEVFVLDSGWYNRKDWSREVGDYFVNKTAFPNGLEELANHVRARGMKFGIWVEIESAGVDSQLLKQHPEWMFQLDGKPVMADNRAMLHFAKPEVRKWAHDVVNRLVRDFGIEWIKIDHNLDVGSKFDGPSGLVLFDHIRAYYDWLDEVRQAHPKLIVENCSSGGLRFDLGIIGHTHATWVSDEVKPVPSLMLGYGCTLEFAPEVCNHWMVGEEHHKPFDPTKEPGWYDFMFRVPMNGQWGISSRVNEWTAVVKQKAIENVKLYKSIREVIAGADVYHLTPPPPYHNPPGWMAIEYVNPKLKRGFLRAYRLAGGEPKRVFTLHNGKQVTVELEAEWRAAIVEVDTQ